MEPGYLDVWDETEIDLVSAQEGVKCEIIGNFLIFHQCANSVTIRNVAWKQAVIPSHSDDNVWYKPLQEPMMASWMLKEAHTLKPLRWDAPNNKTYMFLILSCSCLCPIHWYQVLSREWRRSWNSADRRCSNYIWVINNFITYLCVLY